MAKVLILDRSKSMRNILRERLEYEGFSTEAAEDASIAARLCEKIPFDLILSDSTGGVSDTGVPFIFFGGGGYLRLAGGGVRHGARGFPAQPFLL